MGLDMYLYRIPKQKVVLEKDVFNVKETDELIEKYTMFTLYEDDNNDLCYPASFVELCVNVTITKECYDLEKISADYANGRPVHIGMMSYNKIEVYEDTPEYRGNKYEISSDEIDEKYTIEKQFRALIAPDEDQVMYWRKANQIRKWFVDNTDLNEDDNCMYVDVSKEQLEELIETCKQVLANNNKARSLLPTDNIGCFFGSDHYDEWYFNELENTVNDLQTVIDETDWENENVYYYDWW